MASAINEQVLNTFLAAHARLATAMKGISGQLGGKTPKVSQKDFQELIDSGADLLKESVKLAVLLGVKLEASEDKKTAAKKTTTAKKPATKKAEGEKAPAKKAASKKAAAAATVTVKLVRSLSGRSEKQIATALSLGLKKIGDVTVQPDNAQTNGKIAKISHLVEVTEA